MHLKINDFPSVVDHLSRPHQGIVKDNNDPKKQGRVKCDVPGIYEGDFNLFPWIYPRVSSLLGGGPLISAFHVPEVDSLLEIVFPYKDIYAAVYVGYLVTAKTVQTLFAEDYPESYGFRDSTGNFIHVNKQTGKIRMEHSSGSFFEIDVDGNVAVSTTGDKIIDTDGDVIWNITGLMNITADGNVTINGQVINLNP